MSRFGAVGFFDACASVEHTVIAAVIHRIGKEHFYIGLVRLDVGMDAVRDKRAVANPAR